MPTKVKESFCNCQRCKTFVWLLGFMLVVTTTTFFLPDLVASDVSETKPSTGKWKIILQPAIFFVCANFDALIFLQLIVHEMIVNFFAAKCALKPDTGPCDQKIQRWYFNAKKKKCEQFIYGGCKGNLNRFITAETCKKTCLPTGNCYSFRRKRGHLFVLSCLDPATFCVWNLQTQMFHGFSWLSLCRGFCFKAVTTSGWSVIRFTALHLSSGCSLFRLLCTCSSPVFMFKCLFLLELKVYVTWRRTLGLVIKKLKGGSSMEEATNVRNLHMEDAREIWIDLQLLKNADWPAGETLTKVSQRAHWHFVLGVLESEHIIWGQSGFCSRCGGWQLLWFCINRQAEIFCAPMQFVRTRFLWSHNLDTQTITRWKCFQMNISLCSKVFFEARYWAMWSKDSEVVF